MSAKAFSPLSFNWQWHGRQAFREVRNDWRFSRALHTVIYHLADVVEAPNEVAALVRLQALYPEAQTLGFRCIGPVRRPK